MDQSSTSAAAGAVATSLIIGLIIAIAAIVFAVIIYWKIFAKAGYSGAMGLLMFVPIANLIALCILAFGEWPIYKELNSLRQQVQVVRSQPYPPSQQYPGSPQHPQYPQYSQPPQYPQG